MVIDHLKSLIGDNILSITDKNRFSTDLLETAEEIDNLMSKPTVEVIETFKKIDGDLIVLGCAGKMGPTLIKLAKNSIDKSQTKKKVIGVDRFIPDDIRKNLASTGIELIQCNMLNKEECNKLPDVKNVIYMAGMKFGTTENISLTWALNSHLPTIVAEKYKNSRIVVFSTGNIYHLTPIKFGGATEKDPVNPYGDYAQSCLGRERMFEYFSLQNGTPVTLIRLAYAVDLRYGIILDIAQKVRSKTMIDLSMGNVNLIWQGDANTQILRSLEYCSSPVNILNITGPEIVSIRWLAKRLGELMDIKPIFEGIESDTAILLNASKAFQLFGYPKTTLDQMVQWVANWVLKNGMTLNKPTHFEQRDGKF
jgi:nucleoside-diphosphate-sugar epimerase